MPLCPALQAPTLPDPVPWAQPWGLHLRGEGTGVQETVQATPVFYKW